MKIFTVKIDGYDEDAMASEYWVRAETPEQAATFWLAEMTDEENNCLPDLPVRILICAAPEPNGEAGIAAGELHFRVIQENGEVTN